MQSAPDSTISSQQQRKSHAPRLRLTLCVIAVSGFALTQAGLALPGEANAPAASNSVAQVATSTAGVACPLSYSVFNSSPRVNLLSTSNWVCSSTTRTLTANCVPDHPITGGNFATPISAQNLTVNMPVSPVLANIVPLTTIGYVLNGVKMDPATNGSCTSTATSTAPGGGCVAAMGSGPWVLEAFGGAFVFGTDENNAHVQPNGQYHYHSSPEGYINSLNLGQAMTLVGFAMDGFPVYARYGFTVADDASSPIKLLASSYRKKAVPDAGRPSVSIFPMGTFTPDYEYVAGLGDLDECNGRTGVTPQFPNGIYHYVITDIFPYIQRCIKGDRTIPVVLFSNGFESP
jgi:YHYH protein